MNRIIQNEPMVTLTVDGQEIDAPEGSSLLSACLSAGIDIPHLCWHESDIPGMSAASCRLCWVEIEGYPQPVPSCTETVVADMVVHTRSPEVQSLQETAFKLLLSVHRVDCKNCSANKACSIQNIAQILGVGLTCKPFKKLLKKQKVVNHHPIFDYYGDRCVLCGLCIKACGFTTKNALLSFQGRGFETVIGYFDLDNTDFSHCITCCACVECCPTGAITVNSSGSGVTFVRSLCAPD